jgi:dTDP-4-amino-4,6-dideoxygalactose transaminase
MGETNGTASSAYTRNESHARGDPGGRICGRAVRPRLASDGGAPVCSTPIRVAQPVTGRREALAVADVLGSAWLTRGPRVERFERELAARSSVETAICVSSCTAALELVVQALPLGDRKEVITTPFTFSSTVAAILNAGRTPVLVDVEPGTLAMDPDTAARAVNDCTGALLPVHYAGNPCEMATLLDLAERHDLALVADAAHAFGAGYRGRPITSFGTAACVSFGPTKTITTGEGGAILTSDAALAAEVRHYAYHGIDADAYARRASNDPWAYSVTTLARKHNMNDIAAALGLEQLRRLDRFLARRRELVELYDAAFADNVFLEQLRWRPDSHPAYHLYPVRLRLERLRIDRSRVARELRAEGVETSVHFKPVHLHPYFRERLGLGPGSFPVAEDAYRRILSLPLHPGMTDRDALDVVEAMEKVTAAFAGDAEVTR